MSKNQFPDPPKPPNPYMDESSPEFDGLMRFVSILIFVGFVTFIAIRVYQDPQLGKPRTPCDRLCDTLDDEDLIMILNSASPAWNP